MRLPVVARHVLVPSAMLFGIAWVTAGPFAQGLGDVAKREAARRQEAPAGKKYTNEDLAPAPAVSAPNSSAPAPASPATGPAAAAPDAKAAADSATGPEAAQTPEEVKALANAKMAREKRPESFWRDKAAVVRQAMARTTATAESLKKRLESLEAQMQNGGGSSHVQEREVTLKSLKGAQDDVKSMQGEWDRLEARAKLENIPPDWLR